MRTANLRIVIVFTGYFFLTLHIGFLATPALVDGSESCENIAGQWHVFQSGTLTQTLDGKVTQLPVGDEQYICIQQDGCSITWQCMYCLDPFPRTGYVTGNSLYYSGSGCGCDEYFINCTTLFSSAQIQGTITSGEINASGLDTCSIVYGNEGDVHTLSRTATTSFHYQRVSPITISFLDKDQPTRKVEGAAADGASEIIIQIAFPYSDPNCTLPISLEIAATDGTLRDDAKWQNGIFTQTYVAPSSFPETTPSVGYKEVGLVVKLGGKAINNEWFYRSKPFYLVKPSILLVYGWHGTAENWKILKPYLEADGYRVDVLDYNDTLPALTAASTLATKVATLLDPNQNGLSYKIKKLNIIAHSFGGLVARAYIEQLSGQDSIQRLIMLGTPNHGSPLADYLTGMMSGREDLGVVGYLLSSIADFRADNTWGSSLDLRTLTYNDYLRNLNARFDASTLTTEYFVIAGTGHYPFPQVRLSSGQFLPGCDDNVVQVESAELPGVPIRCVELNHSCLVNPYRVYDYQKQQEELYRAMVLLIHMYQNIIKYILDDIEIMGDSCVGCRDNADRNPLFDMVSWKGKLYSGEGRSQQFIVGQEDQGVFISFRYKWSSFSIVLVDPQGRRITPEVANADSNIDYGEYANSAAYVVRDPQKGIWRWEVQALEVPAEGDDMWVYLTYDRSRRATLPGILLLLLGD
jgi:pimeloyl-ACP methyl ester carboxylesterase